MRDDIANRIDWIHANLFVQLPLTAAFCLFRLVLTRLLRNSLELLPFEDGEFDFVRMKGVGMAVPEDEVSNSLLSLKKVSLTTYIRNQWQSLIQVCIASFSAPLRLGFTVSLPGSCSRFEAGRIVRMY